MKISLVKIFINLQIFIKSALLKAIDDNILTCFFWIFSMFLNIFLFFTKISNAKKIVGIHFYFETVSRVLTTLIFNQL